MRAFVRLGWVEREAKRGHLILTKPGHRATLSVPDHAEVKRGLLQGLLRDAGVTEADYLKAFRG